MKLSFLLIFLVSTMVFGMTEPAKKAGDWNYVGCRTSAGECFHSCEVSADGFKAVKDLALCDEYSPEGKLACYCWIKKEDSF